MIVHIPCAIDMKKSTIKHHILFVNGIEITLAHAHVVDGIQYICFSASVTANKGIQSIYELYFGTLVILKLNQMDAF